MQTTKPLDKDMALKEIASTFGTVLHLFLVQLDLSWNCGFAF